MGEIAIIATDRIASAVEFRSFCRVSVGSPESNRRLLAHTSGIDGALDATKEGPTRSALPPGAFGVYY